MSTIHEDHAAAMAIARADIAGIVRDSIPADVFWDRASNPGEWEALEPLALAAARKVEDYASSLAFEALRGSMTDILPGTDVRTAATVAVLILQGAAFAAVAPEGE